MDESASQPLPPTDLEACGHRAKSVPGVLRGRHLNDRASQRPNVRFPPVPGLRYHLRKRYKRGARQLPPGSDKGKRKNREVSCNGRRKKIGKRESCVDERNPCGKFPEKPRTEANLSPQTEHTLPQRKNLKLRNPGGHSNLRRHPVGASDHGLQVGLLQARCGVARLCCALHDVTELFTHPEIRQFYYACVCVQE